MNSTSSTVIKSAGTLTLNNSTSSADNAIIVNATSGGVDIDGEKTVAIDSATKITIGTVNDKPLTLGKDGGSEDITMNQEVVCKNGLSHSSDKRLKNSIEQLGNMVDKLAQVDAVRYKWNHNGENDIGFIAQNIEPIFPELVKTNDDGMKSVCYHKMTSILVAAVQEQQAMIKQLMDKVMN